MSRVVDMTYYTLLGVSSDASSDEIRKAYRKLSLIHHPDRQASKVDDKGQPIPVDHSKFQALQEAYECLSDTTKRNDYDQFGIEGARGGGGGRGGGMPDMDDLFRSMFGGGPGPGSNGTGSSSRAGQKKQQQNRPGRSSQVELAVTLEECYKGVSKIIQFERSRKCVTCKGSGAKVNTKRRQCVQCKGTGSTYVMRVMGPFATRAEVECTSCEGEGSKVRPQDSCKKCNGRRVVKEKMKKTVNVDRGMVPGEKVILKGEGDEGPDSSSPGNLIFLLTPIVHPTFKLGPTPASSRTPYNLITTLSLTLSESILGFHRLICQHLDGRGLVVNQPAPGEPGWRVLKTGDKVVVKGEGMWKSGDVGDLILEIEVEMPDKAWAMKIRDEKRGLEDLERLLPSKRQDVKHPKDTHDVDFADYVEPKEQTKSSKQATESDDEVDDEDGLPSCQQQ